VTASLLLAALLAAGPIDPVIVAQMRAPPAAETQASSAPPWTGTQEEAIEAIARWWGDPVAFVREMFGAIPDAWQADALRAVASDPRVGMSACKGPGKSCALAWVIWWWEYTRRDAQVICTSITGDNLKDNLWKELAYWYSKAPALQQAFEVKAERITHRQEPRTWWCSARTWARGADPSQQANSLAGFHGRAVMVVLDEMGDYPDGVVVAAEAIFANQDLDEAKLVGAWNPTRTDGPAYRVCTTDRRRWTIIHITGDPDDPRRSPRISKVWAQQMIDDWGRDNDWVRVNVLGLFPNAAEDKLLGPNDIQLACERDAAPITYVEEPIVYGLDVARFGSDSSRLRSRQGPVLFRGHTFRGLDGPTLAQKVHFIIEQDIKDRWKGRRPDYVFVDVTGVGASAFDHLVLLGYRDISVPVDFGGSADDDKKFADKRAEMWWRAARWTKRVGCFPSDSAELGSQLCGPTYKFAARGKRTCFVLESKADMKARGLPSPDDADAFAVTFHTEPLVRRGMDLFSGGAGSGNHAVTDYDPYARS
jgi:hypothetical protein